MTVNGPIIRSQQIHALIQDHHGLVLLREHPTMIHLPVLAVIPLHLRDVGLTGIEIEIGEIRIGALAQEIVPALMQGYGWTTVRHLLRTLYLQGVILCLHRCRLETERSTGTSGIEARENGMKGGTTGSKMISDSTGENHIAPCHLSPANPFRFSQSSLRFSPTRTFPARIPTDRPHSPPSAPRGPRSFAALTPPSLSSSSRIPSGPRSVSGLSAHARDHEDDNDFSGQDLSRSFDRHQELLGKTHPDVIPRGPRSMRGASSPIETRCVREADEHPATVPRSNVPLPNQVKSEAKNQDLEEGEVVSPVEGNGESSWNCDNDGSPRRNRLLSSETAWTRDETRRTMSRHSTSPQKRSRNRTPPLWRKHAGTKGGWVPRGRRRSVSSPVDQMRIRSVTQHTEPPVVPTDNHASQLREAAIRLERGNDLQRPPTPPEPPPTEDPEDCRPGSTMTLSFRSKGPSPPIRPDTPLFPPPPEPMPEIATRATAGSPMMPFRPDTPAYPPPDVVTRPQTPPLLPPRTDRQIHPALPVTFSRSSSSPALLVNRSGKEATSISPGGDQFSLNTVQQPSRSTFSAHVNTLPPQTKTATVPTSVVFVAHFDNQSMPEQQQQPSEHLNTEVDVITRAAIPSDFQLLEATLQPAKSILDQSHLTIEAIASTNLEAATSPETPAASTSASESATTPAKGSGRPSADVEIVKHVSSHA